MTESAAHARESWCFVLLRGARPPKMRIVAASLRSRPGAICATMLVIALAALTLAGCRRPDPVYDRVPQPISTRDLVRAERRVQQPLTEAERRALEPVQDAYLATFEEFRQSDLVPFAAELREVDPQKLRSDERTLRALVGRHLGILNRIVAMDDAFLAAAAEALGPGRANFVEMLRVRRILDRASVVSVGDSGRGLLDLRSLVDSLALDAATRAALEPSLLSHDSEATVVAQNILQEQATLPLTHLAVLAKRGPARPDPSLREDQREKAQQRAEQDRFAESRKDLEILLRQYAELMDRSIEMIAQQLPEESAARLRRLMVRTRVDDDLSRSADTVAFEAMIASRALVVPADVRVRIAAMRTKFLEEDQDRMRRWIEIAKERRTPGVLDPIGDRGGPAAVKEHKERTAAIDRERKEASKVFRDAVFALLSQDVRDAIGELRGKDRQQFTDSLADMVGSGRIAPIVQQRPRGYADRDPAEAAPPQPPNQEPSELRMVLASMPDDAAVGRLVSRSNLDVASAIVLDEILGSWRERWEATREPARARVTALMPAIMTAMNAGDKSGFDRAAQRLIASFDELRREREQLEDELVASFDAALSNAIDPAAREMWVRERNEAQRRLRWRDVPFDDTMRLPSEATIPFLETIGRVKLPVESTSSIAAALAPMADELEQATEALRVEALITVRRAMALVLDGRANGIREEDSLSESRPEVRRMLSPLRSAAERLAALRLETLATMIAALPPEQGRLLREAVVRAAYPRLLGGIGEERRGAQVALEGALADPSLTDLQRSEMEAIIDRRGAARDRALDRLLDWSRTWRNAERAPGDDIRERDGAARRHPELAAVLFVRDEADARAIRAARGVLTDEQAERHRDLDAYFNESVGAVRWLD